jgi:hypothetical protein
MGQEEREKEPDKWNEESEGGTSVNGGEWGRETLHSPCLHRGNDTRGYVARKMGGKTGLGD